MFRASPWISYDPSQRQSIHTNSTPIDGPSNDPPTEPPSSPQEPPSSQLDMDAPEISTLREEEEETPPPDAGGLSFSKFRVNLRMPAWSQSAAASGSAIGPPVGPPPASHRVPSVPDSDDEDEEDQLIDDDELAIVTETGRGPTGSSPASLVAAGSPASTPSPRKRGGGVRGRQRRGGATGRRGRPGREPPDAAAMMSTFEVTKTDQAGTASPAQIIPPTAVMIGTPPQVAGPSTGDWSTSSPPKPPRKKPGPKKGSTLGPRGPRKNAAKTAHNTPGSSTPLLDDPLLGIDPSAFLIPAAPSIPPTPGSDQPPLPTSHLLPILPPDFNLDPTIPIPTYPLPNRAFPVQAPPKVPSGYAPTHPIDTKRGPVRKWSVMQREIKGIAGGRWFARTWVAPQPVPQPATRPSSPPVHSHPANAAASSSQIPVEPGPSRESAAGSPTFSKEEEEYPREQREHPDFALNEQWDTASRGWISGPPSPRTRSPSPVLPLPGAPAEPQTGPP